jgi:hypothetical protein
MRVDLQVRERGSCTAVTSTRGPRAPEVLTRLTITSAKSRHDLTSSETGQINFRTTTSQQHRVADFVSELTPHNHMARAMSLTPVPPIFDFASSLGCSYFRSQSGYFANLDSAQNEAVFCSRAVAFPSGTALWLNQEAFCLSN